MRNENMDLKATHRQLADHLNAEESSLLALHSIVLRMKKAMSQGKGTELQACLDAFQPLARERERLREARKQVLGRLREVGTSDRESPLDRFGDLLNREENQSLRQQRERLRTLTTSIQREIAIVTFLAEHQLEFLQTFFCELTQPAGNATRYGQRGQLQAAVGGSLLQVRG